MHEVRKKEILIDFYIDQVTFQTHFLISSDFLKKIEAAWRLIFKNMGEGKLIWILQPTEYKYYNGMSIFTFRNYLQDKEYYYSK